MAQPVDPIDEILAELRHDFSNILTMLNIVLRLRQNSTQLLGPTARKPRCDLTSKPSMVTLPVDETVTLSSVRRPGERRHALFLCGGRDKAPKLLAGIGIEPRDLATVVDGIGLTGHGVRDLKRGEHARVIEKCLTRGTLTDVGFPEESEKFCTLGKIALINQHLWAPSTNVGCMRTRASASHNVPTSVEASQLAISKNNVLSIR
jgi:hypothetical protein